MAKLARLASEFSRHGIDTMETNALGGRYKIGELVETPTEPFVATVASVTIDHPKEGERITSEEYAFRVSAPAATQVEVSVDGGDWTACREAVGYWWFDWAGFEPGRHRVVARAQPRVGRKIRSMTSHFLVIRD